MTENMRNSEDEKRMIILHAVIKNLSHLLCLSMHSRNRILIELKCANALAYQFLHGFYFGTHKQQMKKFMLSNMHTATFYGHHCSLLFHYNLTSIHTHIEK